LGLELSLRLGLEVRVGKVKLRQLGQGVKFRLLFRLDSGVETIVKLASWCELS
jgi:hypothetical protein